MRTKELVKEMGRLEADLRKFEVTFGVRSADFSRAMMQGELEEFDELDEYRGEFVEWLALYKTWQSLDEKYRRLVEREPVVRQIRANLDMGGA